MQERYRYNSWKNITHGLTLPFPYGDPGPDGQLFTGDDDWGVFANSLWLEPLGKHQILALAGISITQPVDKSFLLFSYVNKQLAPTIALDLYRFPSPSSFYGNGVLVEDLTGGDVSATLPLDVLDKPYSTFLLGSRVRYAYAEPFELRSFTGGETEIDLGGDGSDLPVPEAGMRSTSSSASPTSSSGPPTATTSSRRSTGRASGRASRPARRSWARTTSSSGPMCSPTTSRPRSGWGTSF